MSRGVTVRPDPRLGFVVRDERGRILTITRSRERAEAFVRHHTEARRMWARARRARGVRDG